MRKPVKKLPPSGREYFCFQKDGKRDHIAQCAKWRLLNKLIDTIPEIDAFEQKDVVIEGFLQSERLKQHMIIFVVDQ